MASSRLTEADIKRAKAVWATYQQQHDISDKIGLAVAIDPVGGRVWFGESATAIGQQMEAEGIDIPTLCIRVGKDYYWRKGGRR